jgi:hypothetical protein
MPTSTVRLCACGCRRTLGRDPRALYANGSCRMRALRKRRDAPHYASLDASHHESPQEVARLRSMLEVYQDIVKQNNQQGAERERENTRLRREVDRLHHELSIAQSQAESAQWLQTHLLRGTDGYTRLMAFLQTHPAALKEVRTALALKYHPDRHPGMDGREMQAINAIFTQLNLH